MNFNLTIRRQDRNRCWILFSALTLTASGSATAAQPGEKLWEFRTGMGNALVRATPAISTDGIVVVGSTDWKIYGLDGTTGQKRWELGTRGEVRSAAAIGPDGTAYVGSADRWVYAIETTTGRPLWFYSVGMEVSSSPALGADGTVFAGRYALDGATGQPLWETDAVLGCPVIGSDGTLYAVVRSYPGMGGFSAINGTTGKRIWRCEPTAYNPFSAPALGTNGVLYVGAYGGWIYAFQATSGLAQGPWTKLRGNAQNTGRLAVSAGPAAITEQPLDVQVAVGKPFRLWVWAIGSPPVAFQWYRNGQPVPGGTANVLRVAEAQLAEAGEYVATAANALGNATSHVARVVVGYSLDVVVAGSGTVRVDPTLEVYEPGQSVQLTADAAAGRALLGWQGDATGISNPLTLTMDRSKQLQAIFSTDPGEVRWQFTMRRPAPFTPALGKDGTVYVGSELDACYALDGVTGQKRWEFRTGGVICSCPAIGADGTVYVGSRDARLHALDGTTGAMRWQYETGGEVVASPAVASDGTVFVGSLDAKVYALDGVTGQKRWDFASGGAVDTSAAIGADGTVFVGAQPDRVYALDPMTGQQRWEYRTGRGVSSPCIGPGDTVYVGSPGGGLGSGAMYALNGTTGQKLWEYPTSGAVAAPAVGSDGTLYFSTTELVFGPPPFYFSSFALTVYALHGVTGQVLWSSRRENDSADSSPVIGMEGNAYLGSTGAMAQGGRVYALDLVSGQMRRWFHAGDIYSCPAIAADGTIYVGSSSRLYALAHSDARPIWEYQTDGGGVSPPAIGADGTTYWGVGTKLYAFYGSGGLAQSSWPKSRGNARNTGRVEVGQTPPRIVTEPAGLSVPVGGAFSLTIVATGNPPLSYQWHLGGQPIVGATRLAYEVSQAQMTDGGDY